MQRGPSKDGRFFNRGGQILSSKKQQNLDPSEKFFKGADKKIKTFRFHFPKGAAKI